MTAEDNNGICQTVASKCLHAEVIVVSVQKCYSKVTQTSNAEMDIYLRLIECDNINEQKRSY